MKLTFTGALLCLIVSLMISARGHSQNVSYDELIKQVELHQGTPKVWHYLDNYLKKARRENNKQEIVNAYKDILHECDEKYRLVYADSMISAAKESGIRDLIGDSYLSKGIVYYQRNMHRQALDNYITASRYLSATKDLYLKYKVLYSIAQIKYYLGYYHEAISLFRECAVYFKQQEPLPYLKSLNSLTVCYIHTQDFKMAKATNDLTLNESARLGIRDMLPHIENAAALLHFKSKEYRQAIKTFEYLLPVISKDKDVANRASAHFYLGSSYWAIGSHDAAIGHFKAVDTIFSEANYLRPELRQNYEYLIRYYHHKNMPDEELMYINHLLKADSLLTREFSYLVKKVHKEYDTAELLIEKEKIQVELNHSKWSGIVFKSLVAMLGISLLYILYRHRKLQKIYRQRFEALIKNDSSTEPDQVIEPKESLDINPAIVQHILVKLNEFENKKSYLKKDINAMKLADSFETNYKYLSKVIRAHREKSFVNYINDLRIDYLVARLKDEPLIRRYTNLALAEEAGFSTAQHFTTAFKKRAGISSRYFVDKLGNIHTSN